MCTLRSRGLASSGGGEKSIFYYTALVCVFVEFTWMQDIPGLPLYSSEFYRAVEEKKKFFFFFFAALQSLHSLSIIIIIRKQLRSPAPYLQAAMIFIYKLFLLKCTTVKTYWMCRKTPTLPSMDESMLMMITIVSIKTFSSSLFSLAAVIHAIIEHSRILKLCEIRSVGAKINCFSVADFQYV